MRLLVMLFWFSVLWSGVAGAAEPQCKEYSVGGQGWHKQKSAACTAFAEYVGGANGGSGVGMLVAGATACRVSLTRPTGGACPDGTYTCPFTSDVAEEVVNERSVVCEESCTTPSGTKQAFGGLSGSAPSSQCVQGCAYKASGISVKGSSGAWGANYVSTGASCNAPTGDKPGVNCVSSSSGTYCASKQKKNCGQFNGETMCVDSVPEGGCVIGSKGGALCVDGSLSAPDDGGGGAATPSATATSSDAGGSTTNYNYYNSSVVGGSSTPVTGASTGGADGSSSDGDGEGETGGEGCTGDDCYGAEPSLGACDEDWSQCVTSAFSAAAAGIRDSVPLVGLANGLYSALGSGGACPSITFEAFDRSYNLMEVACQLGEEHWGLLRLVFQIGWSLMALRILLDT